MPESVLNECDCYLYSDSEDEDEDADDILNNMFVLYNYNIDDLIKVFVFNDMIGLVNVFV